MYVLCSECPFGIQVDGDLHEATKLVGSTSPHGEAPCPSCGGKLVRGSRVDAAVRQDRHIRRLTPMEAHLLFEGMGFPEERDCVREVLVDELINKAIRKVVAHTLQGTTRTVLEQLELEDGTTIFFSGSPWGALAYRIRKAKPYAGEVA